MKQQSLQRLPEQAVEIQFAANGQRQIVKNADNLLAVHVRFHGVQTRVALWNIG